MTPTPNVHFLHSCGRHLHTVLLQTTDKGVIGDELGKAAILRPKSAKQSKLLSFSDNPPDNMANIFSTNRISRSQAQTCFSALSTKIGSQTFLVSTIGQRRASNESPAPRKGRGREAAQTAKAQKMVPPRGLSTTP